MIYRSNKHKDAGRGFVATFVTCALAMLILMLVTFSQPSLKLRDRYLADYSGSAVVRQLFDNTAIQVGVISGINSTFQPLADGTVSATFSVDVLSANRSAELSNYSTYLQDTFSQAASAVIVPSFGAITSDRVDLMSNTTDFFVDYTYRSTGFEPSPGVSSTSISNLSINFTTAETINSSESWSYEGGNVNVTLSITTANGTSVTNGMMSSSAPHYYWLNVSTGAGGGENVLIYFGSSGARTGVFFVNSTGVPGFLNVTATMPYASSSLWYYNASLNVTKAAIARNSKLLVWEGG